MKEVQSAEEKMNFVALVIKEYTDILNEIVKLPYPEYNEKYGELLLSLYDKYILKYASQFKEVQSNVWDWVKVKDGKPQMATPVLLATKHWIGVGYYKKNL